MLGTLGEELLGNVLRWLPPGDLQNARLACRAAEAAARCRLDALTSLLLVPNYIAGGGPDWARWPRLSKITLEYFSDIGGLQAQEEERLRRCFELPAGAAGDAARAVLGRVDTLVIEDKLGLETLVALLEALPALTALRLPTTLDRLRSTAQVCVAAALAPRLQTLDVGSCALTPSGAAAIRGMQQLRALRFCNLPRAEERAAALAALPGDQLTSLSFVNGPAAALSALPWPQLRELRGVQLQGRDVAALAASAPLLQLLVAETVGEWDPVPAASFARVTHAKLFNASSSFAHTRLSVLLPSLQTLALQSKRSALNFTLSGLTALTCLHCNPQADSRSPHLPSDRTLAGMCALPSLRHLGLTLADGELAHLAQLPSTLVALDVRVEAHVPNNARTLHVDDILLAVAPLSRLTTLHFDMFQLRGSVRYTLASHATLARFSSSLPALRHLELREPPLRALGLAALCMHLSLRTLSVQLAKGEDRGAFDRLAADHAARGLALSYGSTMQGICNTDWMEFSL